MKDRNWDSLLDRRKDDPVKALLKAADKLLAQHPDKKRREESPKKYAKRRTQELRAKERYQKSLARNQWAVTK